MRSGLKVVAAIVIVLGLAMPAAATDITVTPATPACGSPTCLLAFGDQTSQAEINAAIASYLGGALEVYKQNVGEAFDTGAAAAWYTTTYNADLSGGTVTWVGPGHIAPPSYFLVKDGSQVPAWYLYNISNWDGLGTITFSGFWPDQGSISHVSIYGTAVPDGGSMAMLLGMALMGLAGARRLLK